MKIGIQITSDSGSHKLTATLVDNSSATAFYNLLKKAPVTIKMSDYSNFEKYGPIGTSLPRNDTQITTQQATSFCIRETRLQFTTTLTAGTLPVLVRWME